MNFQAKKYFYQGVLAGIFFLAAFFLTLPWGMAQDYPYIQTQDRFDFAQTYLGLDWMQPSQLTTTYLNANGERKTTNVSLPLIPRLTIGGLHFWGHADFYVTFPIAPEVKKGDLSVQYSPGVETGFRLYPLRLEPSRVSPFWGMAWNVRRYQQQVSEENQGPDWIDDSLFSQNVGLVWTTNFGLLEAGYQFYSRSESTFRYPISRTETARVESPAQSYWVGYKWVMDTTSVASSASNQGRTVATNAFTLGIGPSSAFNLGNSSYLEEERPFLEPHPIASIFVDYAIGYYFGKSDFAVNLSYRTIPMAQSAYGVDYATKREVVSLEGMKFFFDYHGFVPFLGLTWNQEKLSVQEKDKGQTTLDISKEESVPGVIFGWDIRPDNDQFVILRTNLRYVPALNLKVPSGQTISFTQLEFNFIQAVFHFR